MRGENPVRTVHVEESRCVFNSTGVLTLVAAADPKVHGSLTAGVRDLLRMHHV